MSFTNPLMLIGLAAVLVPIIIHLFNFRRYKTVYFSNVQMLEDIQKKTKRASQVQQLIALIHCTSENSSHIYLSIMPFFHVFGLVGNIVLPASMAFGGFLMISADLLSRMLLIGFELPVGAITALVGSPVLIYLLVKNRNMVVS